MIPIRPMTDEERQQIVSIPTKEQLVHAMSRATEGATWSRRLSIENAAEAVLALLTEPPVEPVEPERCAYVLPSGPCGFPRFVHKQVRSHAFVAQPGAAVITSTMGERARQYISKAYRAENGDFVLRSSDWHAAMDALKPAPAAVSDPTSNARRERVRVLIKLANESLQPDIRFHMDAAEKRRATHGAIHALAAAIEALAEGMG